MALKNTLVMEDLRRQRFMHREVNRIAIVVWAKVQHIAASVEDKEDDSDKEIFYTPPQSLSKKIFIKLEDHMFQDHNRR
jgi:hypothetical protein